MVLMFAVTLKAQSIVTWTGSGDMDWTEPDSTSWSATYNTNDIAQFNGSGLGTVNVNASGVTPGAVIISSGSYTFSGGSIGGTGTVTKSSSSTVNLLGAHTYTGDTIINGGMLIIGVTDNTSGAASLGSGNYAGNIYVASGATLSFRSASAQTLSGAISGDGNLFKGGNGTVVLSTNNTYTGTTTVAPIGSGTGGGILSVASFNSVSNNVGLGTVHLASSGLGAPTTVANGTITIGANIQNSSVTLKYTGPGETTDRIINIIFNNARDRTLDASGSGLLKFTSAFTVNNSGGNIILSGTGSGEIAGSIPANGGNGVTKSGNGTWILSGTNTYAGPTTVTGGILSINSIGNVNGGASSIGNPGSVINGTIAIGSTTTSAKLTYTGAGNTSDRVIDLAGTTGGVTLDQSGSGLLRFTSDFTASGAGSKTLTLQGSSSGIGEIDGAIVDNSGANKTSLTKGGTGTWILAGTNTYSGTTTITNGTLTGAVGGCCSNSAITVSNASGFTATLGVNVTTNTLQWTCANLTFKTNSEAGAQLKFIFSDVPSTNLAPLNITNNLSFVGNPLVVVSSPSRIPYDIYPLIIVGGNSPSTAPVLSGVTGRLTWGGAGNKTLYMLVPAPGMIITVK